MSTYTVHARRWKRGWELHIDGLGITQSRSLRDAAKVARDYIRLDTGTDPGASGVEIIPEVGAGLELEARAAREAVATAGEAQRDAAARSRSVARKLKDAGLTGRDIAALLNISPQRVSQLLGGHRIKTASARAASEARRLVRH